MKGIITKAQLREIIREEAEAMDVFEVDRINEEFEEFFDIGDTVVFENKSKTNSIIGFVRFYRAGEFHIKFSKWHETKDRLSPSVLVEESFISRISTILIEKHF